jgi:hypothetical protein
MKTWSTYIILAAFILAGCSDEIPDSPVIPPVIPDEDGTVALTIQFPNSGVPSTYAVTADEENKIYNLHILSFIHNSSSSSSILDDKLAYCIEVDATSILDSTTTNIKKAINVKIKNMIERQRLVLVANVPSSVILSTVCAEGRKMSEIINDLRFSGVAWRTDPITTASFPMFGQMTDSIRFHSQSAEIKHKITFYMIRAVAKVNVGVDMYGTGDPALGFGEIFKIQKVYVYNASESGYIAPHDDYLKHVPANDPPDNRVDTVLDKVNLITGGSRATFDVAFPSSGNILERSIYIPESGVLNVSENYTPAFLVVEATYDGGTYWYRIDFTQGNSYVPVLRNHNYVFNITGVRAPGYTSPDAAANAPVSQFSALVLNDTRDIGLKEVVYTDDYYLAVSSTYIEVNEEVQDVWIDVKSTFTGGAWSTIGKTWVGDIATRTPGVGVLDSFILHTGANTTGAPIINSVVVKSGMLTTPKITIVQRPGANSYITKPGIAASDKQVTIYVKSADKDVLLPPRSISYTYTTDPAQYTPVTLWHTSGIDPTSITYSAINAGSFDVKAEGEGSFVVGMRSIATGKILYSWHIWVTNDNLNDSTKYKSNNGFIFMDRNLGATSSTDYGLYYQWGRKDPFVPGSTPAFGVDTIKPYINYLDSAIQHPDRFYAVPYTSPFDWIGTGGHNNMWTTMDGEKGPYDPCPFGWRVPEVKDGGSGSPWHNFTGITVNGVTYPSAGYLDAFSGERSDAGISGGGDGGVWGATAYAQQAYIYKFNTGTTSSFRAYGYPVRCVKDTR